MRQRLPRRCPSARTMRTFRDSKTSIHPNAANDEPSPETGGGERGLWCVSRLPKKQWRADLALPEERARIAAAACVEPAARDAPLGMLRRPPHATTMTTFPCSHVLRQAPSSSSLRLNTTERAGQEQGSDHALAKAPARLWPSRRSQSRRPAAKQPVSAPNWAASPTSATAPRPPKAPSACGSEVLHALSHHGI